MLVKDIKKGINNSLEEIQENSAKEVEALKEETKNPLKSYRKTTKQVMDLNKTIQDLKREVETIKKSQSGTTLERENIGKKSGTIDESISNRIQEIEETISRAEDSIENLGTTNKKLQISKRS